MADVYTKLPDDTANPTTIQTRQNSRSVNGQTVREHFFVEAYSEVAPGVTEVNASATNVTLKAANLKRTGLMVFNDSEDSLIKVKLGATAGADDYSTQIPPKKEWTLPVAYAGIVDALWENPSGGAVSGSARVTEVTYTA